MNCVGSHQKTKHKQLFNFPPNSMYVEDTQDRYLAIREKSEEDMKREAVLLQSLTYSGTAHQDQQLFSPLLQQKHQVVLSTK